PLVNCDCRALNIVLIAATEVSLPCHAWAINPLSDGAENVSPLAVASNRRSSRNSTWKTRPRPPRAPRLFLRSVLIIHLGVILGVGSTSSIETLKPEPTPDKWVHQRMRSNLSIAPSFRGAVTYNIKREVASVSAPDFFKIIDCVN